MTLAFTLTLLRPAWLLVLLAIPLFALVTLRAVRGRPRAGDWAALAARAILVAALALALAVPRVETGSEGRCVAYVLDVSESVPPSSLQAAGTFIRESASLRGEEDDAAFVVCADGAAVESPFARVTATIRSDTAVIDPDHVATRLPRSESDLAAGLRIARAAFPPGGSRRIVLATDGNEARGDALAAVRELLADRVDVQVVPVRYERQDEVLVEKLVAPSSAGSVAPVPLRVVVRSTHDAVGARIRLLVDEEEVAAQDAVLKRGTNVFEIAHTFERPGFHRVEAIVEPAKDGDPVNNRGRAAVIVRGEGRVLVVSNAPGSPLAGALSEHLDAAVDVGDATALPTDPGGYVPYDAVVLENVAAYALSDEQRRILAAAVRDLGLGLVCVGGPLTYGPGGYAGTDLEAILPVTCDISNKRVLPAGALVVVLHTCEFARGNVIGRDVTKRAVRALSSNDEFGVLVYDTRGTDRWAVPLQRAADKDAICEQVDAANPSDMPSFASITQMAWEGLQHSDAAVKHMLFISDGDPAMPDAKLTQQIYDERISISAVVINPHSAEFEAPMRRLAESHGGRFYSVKDSSRLPEIFVKEAVTVRRSAVREEAFQPEQRAVHRMLRDVDAASFPPLRGYVVTSERPQTEVVLTGPEGDPVLATWRHGLGQSVAWTSDASHWARDWVAWGGYGRVFAQVVKSSLRALGRAGARATTDVSGGAAHVSLDVLDADGGFANGLQVDAIAVLPDGSTRPFAIEQTGQGRYEGTFPATQVGTSLVTLTWRDPASPDAPTAQTLAAVCVAYSAEHLAQRSNERLFATLESAGATILDVDALDDALARDPAAPNARALPWKGPLGGRAEALDLWPWIAAAAALLLVADVAVRRVRIPWEKLVRRRATRRVAPPLLAARGAARPAPTGSFDPASAPPPAAQAPSPETPRPAAPPAPAAPRPEGGGLLDAKRRAQRRETWERND